jgi:hypothetical protein
MSRKKPHIHYIYKTTCNVTKRYYIGMHSTIDLEDGYLGSGKRLRYSIRKYGKENHTKEILEFLPTREELVIRESKIVNDILLEDVLCMNLKPGGQGGFVNDTHKQKFKDSNKLGGLAHSKKLKEDVEYLKNHIDKISKRWKGNEYGKNNKYWVGRKHKNETIRKMIQSHKNIHRGELNSQYGTCWITNEIENKKINKNEQIPLGWRYGRVIKKKPNNGK